MARKRKKYPKLPNGYGSITYLGSGRRNPYGVYLPATEEYPNGQMKRGKCLCYVADWNIGFAVLTAYKAGTYTEGMEKELAAQLLENESDTNKFIARLLSDHNIATHADRQAQNHCPTFAEVYERYYDWKYNGKKKLSEQSKRCTQAAYKNCSVLHERKLNEITFTELQAVLDDCPLKHASLELMCALLKQMFKFAIAEDIVQTNPTEMIKINIEDDDEHGVPFSQDELNILWKHKKNEIVEVLLIMCYSGYRIGELKVITTDLKNKSFQGGLKTRTSKERIVPIHSAIFDIVKGRIKKYGEILPDYVQAYRKDMYDVMDKLRLDRHTPHDCRHTFSMLCEQYRVNENDRKRMLGHKIGDITNDIYGHRTLEELRAEIEKIKA